MATFPFKGLFTINFEYVMTARKCSRVIFGGKFQLKWLLVSVVRPFCRNFSVKMIASKCSKSFYGYFCMINALPQLRSVAFGKILGLEMAYW